MNRSRHLVGPEICGGRRLVAGGLEASWTPRVEVAKVPLGLQCLGGHLGAGGPQNVGARAAALRTGWGACAGRRLQAKIPDFLFFCPEHEDPSYETLGFVPSNACTPPTEFKCLSGLPAA